MASKEQIYDEKIAPVLFEVAAIAKDHDIDFVASVDISDEENPYATGCTRCVDMRTAHAAMRLIYFASSVDGNVDLLMMRLLQDQKDKPHGSAALTILRRLE